MKIALVSPYDFSYPGGVVNHISSLERRFTAMGHEVRVIAPASKAVTSFGDRFIPVGKPRSVPASGSVVRITLSPWLSTRVKEIFKREKFDVCHLHEPLMPMLCTTVLRLAPMPTVGTFHASGGRPWYSFGTPIGKNLLNKWFYKLDARIAVSEAARDYANRYFPAEYNIIPNGIDNQHFHPDVLPIEEYNDGKLNILFVGRLEKRKGVGYLIEAYRRVKRELPDSRLIIVGPGTLLRHRYERRIGRYGLKDVVFIGYAAYSELPRYYKTADIVCLPATGCESFGIVLLEAMAVGRPLVASDIQGYRSVVTHNREGLLVPPRNVEKLTGALLTLLKDESLRRQMGNLCHAKAINYDWGYISNQVMNCYLQVLGQTPPSLKYEKALVNQPAP